MTEQDKEKIAADPQEEASAAVEMQSDHEKAPVADSSKTTEVSVDAGEHETEEDHPEVESDEHEEDAFADEHNEVPDYAHMDHASLLKEADRLLREESVNQAKSKMEAIKSVLYKSLDDLRQEKLHDFIEDGGQELDFEFIQPERQRFREIYAAFRVKRREQAKALEAQLNQNLLVKQNLIERLKELASKEEGIGDSFKEFREIQEKWHATGPVPRSESQNLWNTFKHFEEAFYDFIRISKELRDLDFKKNLEAKEMLCEQAEELLKAEVSQDSFLKLQNLHKKWKSTGPVDAAHREPIWERFSEATKAVHEKRRLFFEDLDAKKKERLAQKAAVIEAINQIDLSQAKNHNHWQQITKQLSEFMEAFKKIGRINDPENDVLWDRFREAGKRITRARNAFYTNQKKVQHENLERKRALLARAEALKDSTDWKETAAELKKIQQEWKTIGFISRGESEKIWQQFRKACNQFFDRLTEKNKGHDAERMDAFNQKKTLLEQLNTLADDAPIDAVKQIITEWKSLGPVPRGERQIEHDFSNALDHKFKALKVSKHEARMIRFENKLNQLVEAGDTGLLDKEVQNISQKIDEMTKELRQFENNINFFSNSNSKNPLVKEVQKNIDRLRDEIQILKDQRKVLSATRRNTTPS
jgi:hypothetical protein